MRHRAFVVPGLIFLLALASCAGDAPARTGWTGTIDTLDNGTVLVSNPEQGIWREGEGWRLVEELRIGAADAEGPEVFGSVIALEVDERGRIYVADSQAHEIRVFGPDGGHLHSFGRRGGGPGEFEQIAGMAWGPEGNLWVVDNRNQRFSVFDPGGRFVTSHRRAGGFFMLPWPGRFDPAGRLYDTGSAQSPDGRFRAALIRYGADMQPSDTFRIPEYEGESFTVMNDQGLPIMSVAVPFTPVQVWRLDPEGYVWLAITDRYRLHRQSFAGDTVRIVERTYTPARVSAAEKEETLERFRWFTEQGGRIDLARIPDTKPAFQGMFFDDRGHLWVRPHQARGVPPALEVFDAEGRYLGRVPSEVEIAPFPAPVIRGDRMYVVVRDELDVPYVVRLRIEGRAGAV